MKSFTLRMAACLSLNLTKEKKSQHLCNEHCLFLRWKLSK
uniref:Uncharacterized protein n=1 Tax=Arundo donax TaxID=35708 RepID=A0A0A9ECU9_ARUDO